MTKNIVFFFFIFSFVSLISEENIPVDNQIQALVFNKNDLEVERSKIGTVADKVVYKTKNIFAYTVVKMFAFFRILKTYLTKSVNVVSETSDNLYGWASNRIKRKEELDVATVIVN